MKRLFFFLLAVCPMVATAATYPNYFVTNASPFDVIPGTSIYVPTIYSTNSVSTNGTITDYLFVGNAQISYLQSIGALNQSGATGTNYFMAPTNYFGGDVTVVGNINAKSNVTILTKPGNPNAVGMKILSGIDAPTNRVNYVFNDGGGVIAGGTIGNLASLDTNITLIAANGAYINGNWRANIDTVVETQDGYTALQIEESQNLRCTNYFGGYVCIDAPGSLNLLAENYGSFTMVAGYGVTNMWSYATAESIAACNAFLATGVTNIASQASMAFCGATGGTNIYNNASFGGLAMLTVASGVDSGSLNITNSTSGGISIITASGATNVTHTTTPGTFSMASVSPACQAVTITPTDASTANTAVIESTNIMVGADACSMVSIFDTCDSVTLDFYNTIANLYMATVTNVTVSAQSSLLVGNITQDETFDKTIAIIDGANRSTMTPTQIDSQAIFGGFGTMALTTNIPTYALNSTTNVFTNCNYVVSSGCITNNGTRGFTNLVAGYFRVSIGASYAAGGAANSVGEVWTNGVKCDLIGFVRDFSGVSGHGNASSANTVYLPANTYVQLAAGADASESIDVAHVDFSISPAN